jgi:hypothetical protein
LCIELAKKIGDFLGILPVHSNDGSAAHLGWPAGKSIIDDPGASRLLTGFVALSHTDTIIAEARHAKGRSFFFVLY